MKQIFKKLTSITLAVLLLMSLCAVSVSAETVATDTDLTCEHPDWDYCEVEGGHQKYCYDCENYFDDVTAHSFKYGYYSDNGDGTCSPGCDYCWYIDTDKKLEHDMSYWCYNSSNECVNCCSYCYGNGTIVEHDFSAYVYYDSENCVKACSHCEYYDFENPELKPHVFGEVTSHPATEEEGAYTEKICQNCEYTVKEYSKEGNIYFELANNEEYDWDARAILVYRNGTPWKIVRGDDYSDTTFAITYDKNSSYVFKWLTDGYDGESFGIKIYIPGKDEAVYSKDVMDEVENFTTLAIVNCADYTAVDTAMAKIPERLEDYTAESVTTLYNAVKAVKYMLPLNKQAEVDKMAENLEAAIAGLKETETPAAHGVINLAGVEKYFDILAEGYEYDATYYYVYTGKYYLFDSSVNPMTDTYTDYSVCFCFNEVSAEFDVEIANLLLNDENYTPFYLCRNAKVNLSLIGTNSMIANEYGRAGIYVDAEASLTINKSEGSLVAIGGDNAAGIGGSDDYDYEEYDYSNCGDVTINGGTIFALSQGDGAGIGGAYEGGCGTITINDGVIHAECMSDDGSGIGVGDDGNGGKIIINGGKITALSLDDDGAGIGGADSGSIDEITINGGDITVGSEDGAGIGGGQESSSQGGKITINGGTIRAHEKHDSDENLIGNGSIGSAEESETNFVQINGGNIISEGTQGVYPEPKNESGETLEKVTITVHETYKDKEVTLILSNDTELKATAIGTTVYAYIPSGVTVTNADELAKVPNAPTVPTDPTVPTVPTKPTQPTTPACVHSTVLKNFKLATYFAKGYSGDTVCVKCNKTISKGTVTDKLTLKTPKLKVKSIGGKIRINYKKVSGATGFQVRYKIKGKWKIKTFTAKKNVKRFIKKLKAGKYKVQIRSMAKSGKWKSFSKWSKTKKVTIK